MQAAVDALHHRSTTARGKKRMQSLFQSEAEKQLQTFEAHF